MAVRTSAAGALRGALITLLALFGGLLLGVAVGELVFNSIPSHRTADPAPLHILLAALPALGGMLAGAALWGVLMGRGVPGANRRRLALAGALGFAPIAIGVGIALSALEPVAVSEIGRWLPIHRVFTLLFVPSAFLVAGVGAAALGLGLGSRRLAWSLGWRAGLAAAAGFLLVNLLMDAAGWRVGAPHAADRATMLTVMFAGNIGAALAAGALLGARLAQRFGVNVAPLQAGGA